jgi:predicted RNase H-like HicB family nuclease
MMKYHFKLHKDTGDCWVYWTKCCELKGCLTEGNTLEELYTNCAEALDVYLYTPQEDTESSFPLPDKRLDGKKNIIAIPVQPDKEAMILSRQRPRMTKARKLKVAAL